MYMYHNVEEDRCYLPVSFSFVLRDKGWDTTVLCISCNSIPEPESRDSCLSIDPSTSSEQKRETNSIQIYKEKEQKMFSKKKHKIFFIKKKE